MPNKINNNLMILEIEKEQAELRLKDQIKSIRYVLDNLESKLNNNESLYESDGLQGNVVWIDIYLSKIAAYEKSIERFKAHLEKDK